MHTLFSLRGDLLIGFAGVEVVVVVVVVVCVAGGGCNVFDKFVESGICCAGLDRVDEVGGVPGIDITVGGGVVLVWGTLGSRLVITICAVFVAASPIIILFSFSIDIGSIVEALDRTRCVLFCTIFVARLLAAAFLFSLGCLPFVLLDVFSERVWVIGSIVGIKKLLLLVLMGV